MEDWSVTGIEDIGIPVAEGAPCAQKIFENLEVESKVIPVVGRYVGAVADVGLTLVGMIEVNLFPGSIGTVCAYGSLSDYG